MIHPCGRPRRDRSAEDEPIFRWLSAGWSSAWREGTCGCLSAADRAGTHPEPLLPPCPVKAREPTPAGGQGAASALRVQEAFPPRPQRAERHPAGGGRKKRTGRQCPVRPVSRTNALPACRTRRLSHAPPSSRAEIFPSPLRGNRAERRTRRAPSAPRTAAPLPPLPKEGGPGVPFPFASRWSQP